MDGILIINKEKDWTSFDVVAKVRNTLKVKVGHTGTLDPKATGVLVLCLGKATKLAQTMTGFDKEYVAEVMLGATSNTDDSEGEIIETPNAKELSQAEVTQALESFKGQIEQVPPQFSAKKIDGRRAYKMARAGKIVDLKPSIVTVYDIEILSYTWPTLSLKIKCGKGTYIRSIARDLGEKLKVGGYLSALERTAVGKYRLEDAIKIGDLDVGRIIPL